MGIHIKNFFTINNLLIILSILTIISSTKQTLFQNNIFLRKLQDDNNTDTNSTNSTNTSDTTNTTIEITIPTTIPENSSEIITTIASRTQKSGIGAGGIVGIVIPCVAAVGGVAVASFALGRKNNTPTENNNVLAHNKFDSSMSKFNTNPIQTNNNGAIPVNQVVQQTPVVQEHPIYPIKKEEIPVPKNNDVFEAIQPIEKATPINPEVPTQNIHQAIASQTKLVPGVNAINNAQQIVPQNVVSTTNPSSQVIPVV